MPRLDRRSFLGALPLIGTGGVASAAASEAPEAVTRAITRFAALPVDKASCLIDVAKPGEAWQAAHRPDDTLFVGSAVKTFILAAYLRAVETGRLSETEQSAIDDSVRSLVSPVFQNLTGTTTARSVLEAMICHSDNTATDVALAAVGPEAVRALIAEAGLSRTKIPNSTRSLFSFLAGAPPGVDLGWATMKAISDGKVPDGVTLGPARLPTDSQESMLSTASELVRWYRDSFGGRYFTKAETLTEYRRIQAMADALALIVPPGVAAYGKGGSIEWNDFRCFCVAGQLVAAEVPIGFAFTVNWRGDDASQSKVLAGLVGAVSATLAAAVDAVRR